MKEVALKVDVNYHGMAVLSIQYHHSNQVEKYGKRIRDLFQEYWMKKENSAELELTSVYPPHCCPFESWLPDAIPKQLESKRRLGRFIHPQLVPFG
ncbi:hypothetical protein LINGRAHAP2_LOCUS23560 [Linum grandiflorum]